MLGLSLTPSEIIKSYKNMKFVSEREANESIMIVDGTNLFMRSFAAYAAMNDNGEYVGGVIGSIRSLAYIVRNINPTRGIIVFDGENNIKKRKKLLESYKEHRGFRKRKYNRHHELSLEEEEQSKIKQLNLFIEYCVHLPLQKFIINSVESDDVIAYIGKYLFEESDKTIVSTDRDFYQLVDNRLKIYSPIKKITVDEQFIKEEFNLTPKQFLIYRVHTGDKSDNINGIRGIGLSTFHKLYRPLIEQGEHVLDAYIQYAESKQDEGKLYRSIVENKDILYRNLELMNLLKSNNMNADIRSKLINACYNKPLPRLDIHTLIELANRDKIKDMLHKDFVSYLHTNFAGLDYIASNYNKRFEQKD